MNVIADLFTKIFRMIIPPEFTITIRDGVAKATQGRVPVKVLSEFSQLAEQQRISRGTIYGVREGNRVSLKFSSRIAESDRQRFRNTWNVNK